MALSRDERKRRLPRGAQKAVVAELREEGLKTNEVDVSLVQNDKAAHINPKKVEKIQLALAKRMRPRVSVAEAFGMDETKVAA